jgi:lipopolysaccharide/colanic/teichoic acid biosynthesis glycosyltransferase
MKRLFDIVVSLLLIIFFSPILLIVALWIKSDGGSAFFFQTRVGFGGRPFKIFKFRSMIENADKIGGYSTIVNDTRITRIGRFIRKTSIDELPQLLNVLLGDMSLVGPRPNVFAQVDEYSKEQWDLRNSVIPGITGMAQVMKRSTASWEERFELDRHYILNYSFTLDVKILFLTVKQVFLKGGY